MIEMRHIRKAYTNSTPFKDLNVQINQGDVIAIIGHSGCGKSTLLRMINLLDRPTSGQIIVDGVDITAPDCKACEVRRKIGMVFQSFNLFGHLTVLENVMVPAMDLLGISKPEAYDRAVQLLRKVGMDGRAMQYPDVLSGGQKQRVAIARTLAMDPEIILFDEPTSALDPTMVGEVQSVIRDLALTGTTMMIVTHEMRFAREISNRVFYLDEGGIYEDGTPEQIFEHPRKPLTRRFIRQLKVFETTIDYRYDFKGVVTEIEQYGQKNNIEKKQIYALQSIFEELCQQILLEHDPECRIRFAVEYSDKTNDADVTVCYSGGQFDPETEANGLAISILKSRTESYEYIYDPEAEYSNKINMHVL